MGLFDNLWSKSSYVSIENGVNEADNKRQTSAPLLAEHEYNNMYDSINGQSSTATAGNTTTASPTRRLIRKEFTADTKTDTTDEYEVKLNDNINSIAARFWTTPAAVKKLNRMSDNHLFVGQIILVPKLVLKRGPDGSAPKGVSVHK